MKRLLLFAWLWLAALPAVATKHAGWPVRTRRTKAEAAQLRRLMAQWAEMRWVLTNAVWHWKGVRRADFESLVALLDQSDSVLNIGTAETTKGG